MPAHDTVRYPIERYLNVRGVASPVYFSDGSRLAFLSDITGVSQVWAVDIPAPGEPPRWPDQLTFDSERVVWVRTAPAPGDSRVFYARDQSGSEKMQLFVLDPVTGQETALTAGYESAMHLPCDVSHDGTRVLYAANRRVPGLFDLYDQPVDGPARLVWQNEQPGFVSAVYSPDDRQALVRLMISSFEHTLIAIDLATGAARPLTPDSGGPVRYETPCFSADGRVLYVLTDRESDFMGLARLDLDTLAWETLVAPEWDIEGIVPSPDGRWLAYAVNADGVSDLYIYDTHSGASERVPALDRPGIVTMLGELQVCFSPDARQVAYMSLLATRSGDIWIWDRDLETARPVTRSAHGGLPLEFVRSARVDPLSNLRHRRRRHTAYHSRVAVPPTRQFRSAGAGRRACARRAGEPVAAAVLPLHPIYRESWLRGAGAQCARLDRLWQRVQPSR